MSGKQKSRSISHALGGPSTSRGRDYQIDYAVYRALRLIIGHFAAPHKHAGIALEPRVVDAATGAVSAWDILTEPDPVVWEAKLVASKKDVIEWMERIRHASETNRESSVHGFGLVYSQVKTPLVASLTRLRDVALESEGNRDKFDALTADSECLDTVATSLGPAFRELLGRLKFESNPEGILRNQIEDRARLLAGEDHECLTTFLFRRFSEAAAQRRHYDIAGLIETISQHSIHLFPPPGRAFAEVPAKERGALLILSHCPAGLSTEALASAIRTSRVTLQASLAPFIQQKIIVENGDVLRCAAAMVPPTAEDLGVFADAFDGLLDWLSQNEVADSGAIAARGAIALAPVALKERPGLALKFFQATEHVIKNLGDKHLLLQVSEMCIHVANDPSERDRDLKAKAKAQAMLCGHSWVYQRTGRLEEAEVLAERSEQLGESIGWARNTAFAKKCRGRLARIRAEHCQIPTERASLLEASERLLGDAIFRFSVLPDFGPDHRQSGDCHCLLGRTRLVGRKATGTRESVQAAFEILTPSAIKEYFDLLILAGDVEAAQGNNDAAERYYSEVIDSHHERDRELSEICARALRQRGELRATAGRKPAAVSDFQRAAETWRMLDEHSFAADVDWRRMQIEGRFSREILRAFSGLDVTVRVAAVTDYLQGLNSLKALAHRSSPTKSQVEQFAQAARKRVAEEHPDW